ncbi:beta-mannosidase [Hymenobacter armeniacus]|uniref:Glycoside hydrolase family 2 n=1 Tax=Hymenobacter armeniacus TaxID=2771358 RepID=A0ABR8JVY8_9BACT|nr:sugar-binding domain-containing protein [Hymenobacter armeniacus]MBD2723118.1 glycoside hydrolase family 2 [Hymenobacter armeniacus]
MKFFESSGLRVVLLLSAFGLGSGPHAQAQYKLNYGLKEPQEASLLPRAAAPLSTATRKPKVAPSPTLTPTPDGSFLLRHGWELTPANAVKADGAAISTPGFSSASWYNATVPGTVLGTLVDQGVYPDPYLGLNNLHIPDSLSRQAWWYRTAFAVPAREKNKTVWLQFQGINYAAEVWLNGRKVGTMQGAFKRGRFDISSLVSRTGPNALAVHILPPPNPGIPHEESARTGQGPNGGLHALDGPAFISSEGWDWVPGIRDRNMGLWQDVSLKFTDDVTLQHPQVITDLPLPDTTRADLTIRTEVANHGRQARTVTLKGEIEGISFSQKVSLQAGEQKTVAFTPAQFPQLRLVKPHLWWPNGYGAPALYPLRLTVAENGRVSDQQTLRFGIRELSYEMTVDGPAQPGQRVEFNPLAVKNPAQLLFDNTKRREVEPGVWVASLRLGTEAAALLPVPAPAAAPYLVLKVNGQRIYCKGGNWGMDDGMKRVSRAHLEPYFKLHQNAHFNMIRNWTGESTEEAFYDLADEYGMLIWNDFWISTEGYNLEPTNNALFLDNAQDIVRHFRNHPSIAIWCPRNEGYAPVPLEDALASLIMQEDGTRFYQGNSRNLNLRPSGPWHYFKSPVDYFNNNAQGFTTEIGTFSVPEAETIRKFIPKADLWPVSDTWYYHDFHEEQGQKDYIAAANSRYGASAGVDEFAAKLQFLNYDSHRAIFEAWNSKLWHNTSGVLLWMTHPAWPSMIWQTYTYDYQTHASYYGAQKACEPIHAQMNLHDNCVVVINSSLKTIKDATVQVKAFALDGKELFAQQQRVQVAANQLTTAFTPELPASPAGPYLVRVQLLSPTGAVISRNEYWKAENDAFQSFARQPPVQAACKITARDASARKLTFRVSNPAPTAALNVRFVLLGKDQQPILPAYFSDAYFTLLPNESRLITVEYPEGLKAQDLSVASGGFNVK